MTDNPTFLDSLIETVQRAARYNPEEYAPPSAVLWPDEQLDLPEIDQRIPIVDNPKLREYLPKLEAYPRRVFKSHEPYRPYYLKGKVALESRPGDVFGLAGGKAPRETGGKPAWPK